MKRAGDLLTYVRTVASAIPAVHGLVILAATARPHQWEAPMLRRTTVALAVFATVLAVPTPRAEADPVSTLQAMFNDPQVDGSMDTSLQDAIGGLIDGAAVGSRIDIAAYTFENQQLADKLFAAYERGVSVTLVAEACPEIACGGTNPGPGKVLTDLQAELPVGSVVFCVDGCLGPGTDINHQKIWVFSQLTDGRTDVVVQSSENIPDGPDPLHNNLLISANDPGLANGYQAVITKMKTDTASPWSGTITSTSGKVTVWMSPRDTAADEAAYGDSDFLAAQLNDIDCSQGGTIRFVESQWSSDRPHVDAAVLAAKQSGCQVEILVSASNQTVQDTRQFVQAGIPVYMFRVGGCRYGINGCVGDVHSKIILVDGYSTTAGMRRHFVYMGSHNINNGSLANADDALVRIDDANIYAAYSANFQQLHDEAIKILPAVYPHAALTSVNTLNNNGAGDQRSPAIATSRTGYRAVVWEDDADNTTATGTEVWIREYAPNGQSLYETRADAGGTGNWSHLKPDVGVDDAGNAYVVWSEDADGNGSYNIDLRKFTTNGTASAPIFPNDPEWRGNQLNPHISVTPNGAFDVVWEDQADPSSATTHVHAAGYSSVSARVWGPVQVDAAASANRPDVALDGAGAATVVWQQATDIAQARISVTGVVSRATALVNTVTASSQLAPAVAVTPTGDSVVAWSSDLGTDANGYAKWRIRIRGFTSAFTARFPETQVTPEPSGSDAMYPPLGPQGTPRIGIADSGQTVVSWSEDDQWNAIRGYEVYAAGANSDGTTVGRFPATRMNPIVQGPQSVAALAVSPTGDFDIAYQSDDDGNGYRDITGRFGFANVAY